MSESDLCEALDNFLSEFSYIGGYQPTEDDSKVFDFATERFPKGEMAKYLHFSRWFCHLTTFSLASRAAFSPGALVGQRPEILSLVERSLSEGARTVSTNPKAINKKEVSSLTRCGMYSIQPLIDSMQHLVRISHFSYWLI